MTEISKADCRKLFKAQRATLQSDPVAKRRIEEGIRSSLAAWIRTHPVTTPLFAFWALPHEWDITPLIALFPDRTWALPRVAGRLMQFHRYQIGDRLVAGSFGIHEPRESAPVVIPTRSTIILCPGLAFTRQGHRLGYGGGYYDTYISTHNQGCIKVGVTPESLVTGSLPTEPHDITMNALALESGVISCEG